MICPSCRQDAPTIVRGVRAFCTACGAPRPLLGSSAVNVAGKPMKAGGTAASVIGWVVLFLGTMGSLAMGALFNMLWSIAGSAAAGTVGLIVGGFFGVITLVVALSLLLGGRSMQKTGEGDRRKVLEQGIFALAGRQRGSVTPRDVARQLAITDEEADALLTDLARNPNGRVSLDVDDDGTLRYTVPELLPPVRIDPSAAKSPKVRVDPKAAIPDAELEEDAESVEKDRDRMRR
jgi:membrane protein implicated in regulation of membrane protease activity